MSTAYRMLTLNNLQTIGHVSLVCVSTSRIVCRRVQDRFKSEEDDNCHIHVWLCSRNSAVQPQDSAAV